MRRSLCIPVVVVALLLPGAAARLRAADLAEPASSLAQQIALEATRQEMIQSRLEELAGRFQALAADLRSNPAVAPDVQEAAVAYERRLLAVRDTHLEGARKLLSRALKTPVAGSRLLADAHRQIGFAAREIASLLLQAGMSQAAEVFAREVRDIADKQEELQRPALEPPEGSSAAEPALSVRQKDLADQLAALGSQITGLEASSADALATVRVARARKLLEAAQAVAAMQAAAAVIDRDPGAALPWQTKTLAALHRVEIKLRPDVTLQFLVRMRTVLDDLLVSQRFLRGQIDGLDAAGFTAQREVLGRRQGGLLRRLVQLDGSFDLDPSLHAAALAATAAATGLAEGDRAAAVRSQEQVHTALTTARAVLQARIEDIQGLPLAYRRLQDAANRDKALDELIERQVQAADNLALTGKAAQSADTLATAQQFLAGEVQRFSDGLPADSKWTPLIRRPLLKVGRDMAAAAGVLKAGRAAEAKPRLEAASAGLHEAAQLVKKELNYLERMWAFRQLASDMKGIDHTLTDIRDEESDLRGQAERTAAAGKTVLDLTGQQELLAAAVAEADQTVSLIEEASALRPHLAAAQSAMSAAATQLGQDQSATALSLMDQSRQELQQAAKFAGELAARADYLAQWTATLEQMSADAAGLLQRQIILRQQTETAENKDLDMLAGQQDILLAETTVMASVPIPKAGENFAKAAAEMGLAVKELQAQHRDPAVPHQLAAEQALRAADLELQAFLLALAQVFNTYNDVLTPLQLNALSALLLLAMDQGDLTGQMYHCPEGDLAGLAPREGELKTRALELAAGQTFSLPEYSSVQAKIHAAAEEMTKSSAALSASQRHDAVARGQAAEKLLRMAFAEVVRILYAYLLEPPEPPPDLGQPLAPDETAIPFNGADHWLTFARGTPSGADVTRDKAGWESLTARDRAALNENFARELPLEYRQTLKEYYETLAK